MPPANYTLNLETELQTTATGPNDQPSDPASPAALHMPFDNSYARELEGL